MTRLQLIGRIAAAAVLLSAWMWGPVLLRPLSFFAVRRVNVEGARYFQPSAVVAVLELREKASVFDNTRELERRLEAMPGIASARVSRALPGTLRVRITEVEPVALAEGPSGLIPLAGDARPLPYDVSKSPVDAPIVRDAEPKLLQALTEVRDTDPGLYADVAAARVSSGDVVLDMTRGRLRLDLPVDRGIVETVSAVRRDLAARGTDWEELDGRFRGWVVVKRGQKTGDRGRNEPVATEAHGRTRTAAPVRSPVPRPRPARRP